jgi:hypothetical protein
LENLIKIIISPQSGFQDVFKQKSLAKAALIVGLTGLVRSLASFPNKSSLESLKFPITNPLLAFLVLIPIIVLAGFVWWLIVSLFFHGTAKLFRGQGSLTDTILIAGYAQTPYFFSLLLIPLNIAEILTGDQLTISFLISITISIAQLFLGLWVFILLIIGLKQAHRFGYGTATGVACLPIFICLIIVTIIFVVFFASFVGTGNLSP